jgi:hypothetical protein
MLDGFGLAGCRSFRANMQLFGPLGKINLLAGRNNAGKSNVIRAVDQWCRDSFPPTGLDIPNNTGEDGNFEIAIAHRRLAALSPSSRRCGALQRGGRVKSRSLTDRVAMPRSDAVGALDADATVKMIGTEGMTNNSSRSALGDLASRSKFGCPRFAVCLAPWPRGCARRLGGVNFRS